MNRRYLSFSLLGPPSLRQSSPVRMISAKCEIRVSSRTRCSRIIDSDVQKCTCTGSLAVRNGRSWGGSARTETIFINKPTGFCWKTQSLNTVLSRFEVLARRPDNRSFCFKDYHPSNCNRPVSLVLRILKKCDRRSGKTMTWSTSNKPTAECAVSRQFQESIAGLRCNLFRDWSA